MLIIRCFKCKSKDVYIADSNVGSDAILYNIHCGNCGREWEIESDIRNLELEEK